ncbi:MAG TPA: ABC transporter permease, partial [Solirubrobacterales bacterium]|nr:ABC transporter permease [Solirubrobacterales bacterium]
MNGLALVAHQFRYDQKAFWRNPASVFFTVMFPVIVFLILAVVFNGERVDVRGGVEATTYYVPAIMSLAIISATMQTLAMTLVIAREDGRLKRGRGTPLPAWVFVAGRIGNSIVVTVLMLALLAAIGRLLYDVPFPWERLPEMLLVLAIGAASF